MKRIYIRDACAYISDVFSKDICTRDTFARATWIKIAYTGGICTKDIFAKGTWIKIACTGTASIIGAGDTCVYICSICIRGTTVRDDCIRDTYVGNAGIVKRLGIYLQSSWILKLK